MDSEMIQVTAHSCSMKIGRVPDPTNPIPKETRGFPLTYSQHRALFAVQTLLNDTEYKGNLPPVSVKTGTKYAFQKKLPVLEVKVAEYLEAYGVSKVKTKNGMEHSSQGRKIAIGALDDLSYSKYSINYSKTTSKNGKYKFFVDVEAHLLKVEKGNTNRTLIITPNPVLVDQFDTNFKLIPRDLFQRVSGKDPVMVRFVEFLFSQAESRRRRAAGRNKKKKTPNREVRLQINTLAYAMRFTGLLKRRKPGALRKKVNKLYDAAKRLGYLKSVKINQKGTKKRIVDVLQLNLSKLINLIP